jgi:DNA repair protein SbcC/Rad50
VILESIRLVNIKSFEDESLSFSQGINIIAGRNGAGKSTVIEAVGIALFDSWPHKFKDGNARVGFIRRKQGEGSIEIELSAHGKKFRIVCNLGERRRKGKSPTTDYERILFSEDGLQLSASAGRKVEFQEDVRTHILGATRIDDARLFENIIGTAQGTFDEPFTKEEKMRRELFERILGVEDFQRFEKQFGSFNRYLRVRSEKLESNAALLAPAQSELDSAEKEMKQRLAEDSEVQKHMLVVRKAREEAEKHFIAVQEQKEAMDAFRERLSAVEEHQQSITEALAHHNKELEIAQSAEALMKEHAAGYAAYNATENTLIDLRLKKEDREKLKNKYEERQRKHESQRATLQTRLEDLLEREKQNTKELQNFANEKSALKTKRTALGEEWRNAKQHVERLKDEELLARRLESYVTELLGVQKAFMDSDGAIRSLRDELLVLEEDAQRLFERDTVALTSETIQSLKIESAEIFKSVIIDLEQKLELKDLSTLSANVKNVHALTRKTVGEAEQRQASVKTQGESVSQEINRVEKSEKEKNGFLQNVLNQKTESDGKLKSELLDWNAFQTQYKKEIRKFDKLDEQIAECETGKKQYKNAFEQYIHVRSDAAKLDERRKAVKESEQQEAGLHKEQEEIKKKLSLLQESFSTLKYDTASLEFEKAKEQESLAVDAAAASRTKVEEQTRRLKDAQSLFEKYSAILKQSEQARDEHAFFDTVMKEVVRGLAQRVGARIVLSVSDYANQLYTRIAPEQSASLSWDPMNYGIELQSVTGVVKGKELSGGQLMGVSLAIKLALIKWYSQCRIGFLDEPTTHLDKETRRHLSDVIMNLESIASDGAWFDQLFVISHEEALHGAGHRIELERIDGISIVSAVD